MSKGACAMAMAAAIVGTAVPASAQPVSNSKCLLVTNMFANAAGKETQKRSAQLGLFYFLGRTEGNVSDAQLHSEALAMKKLTPAAASKMMEACMRKVEARARDIQASMQEHNGSK